MKWRFVPCHTVEEPTDKRHVLRDKRMAAWTKTVKCLAIHEKHRFLRFVDNQLRPRIEILAGVFPDESLIVPLVFDDLCNVRH